MQVYGAERIKRKNACPLLNTAAGPKYQLGSLYSCFHCHSAMSVLHGNILHKCHMGLGHRFYAGPKRTEKALITEGPVSSTERSVSGDDDEYVTQPELLSPNSSSSTTYVGTLGWIALIHPMIILTWVVVVMDLNNVHMCVP